MPGFGGSTLTAFVDSLLANRRQNLAESQADQLAQLRSLEAAQRLQGLQAESRRAGREARLPEAVRALFPAPTEALAPEPGTPGMPGVPTQPGVADPSAEAAGRSLSSGIEAVPAQQGRPPGPRRPPTFAETAGALGPENLLSLMGTQGGRDLLGRVEFTSEEQKRQLEDDIAAREAARPQQDKLNTFKTLLREHPEQMNPNNLREMFFLRASILDAKASSKRNPDERKRLEAQADQEEGKGFQISADKTEAQKQVEEFIRLSTITQKIADHPEDPKGVSELFETAPTFETPFGRKLLMDTFEQLQKNRLSRARTPEMLQFETAFVGAMAKTGLDGARAMKLLFSERPEIIGPVLRELIHNPDYQKFIHSTLLPEGIKFTKGTDVGALLKAETSGYPAGSKEYVNVFNQALRDANPKFSPEAREADAEKRFDAEDRKINDNIRRLESGLRTEATTQRSLFAGGQGKTRLFNDSVERASKKREELALYEDQKKNLERRRGRRTPEAAPLEPKTTPMTPEQDALTDQLLQGQKRAWLDAHGKTDESKLTTKEHTQMKQEVLNALVKELDKRKIPVPPSWRRTSSIPPDTATRLAKIAAQPDESEDETEDEDEVADTG